MAGHLYCPAVSDIHEIRAWNNTENVRRHLLLKFRNDSHTKRFTMDDIRNEAQGVFRNIPSSGVRSSLRRETRRLMHTMGKMQVSNITKTTIDVSKWNPLHWKLPLLYLNT